MVRGLKEAVDYMNNLAETKYFSDNADKIRARNKLINGDCKTYALEDYELPTQKNLVLQCVFNFKDNSCIYALRFPILRIITSTYDDAHPFGSKNYFYDTWMKMSGIANNNIRDTFGRLNISFYNDTLHEKSYLFGVVDNEIVFMFHILSLLNYERTILDGDTIMVVFEDFNDMESTIWTLKLSLEDYSVLGWNS